MANNAGTLVTSPVRPQSTADRFPTAYANEILGGAPSFQNITLRDAIPTERRQEGMLATVSGVTYRLEGGIANTDWVDILGSTNNAIQGLQSSTSILQAVISAPIYANDSEADNDENLLEGNFYRTFAGGRTLYIKPPSGSLPPHYLTPDGGNYLTPDGGVILTN